MGASHRLREKRPMRFLLKYSQHIPTLLPWKQVMVFACAAVAMVALGALVRHWQTDPFLASEHATPEGEAVQHANPVEKVAGHAVPLEPIKEAVQPEPVRQAAHQAPAREAVVQALNVPARPDIHVRKASLHAGESLAKLLRRYNVPASERAAIAKTLAPHVPLRRLRAGQTLHLHFDQSGQGALQRLQLEYNQEQIEVVRRGKNMFEASKQTVQLYSEPRFVQGEIKRNLYVLADQLDIPAATIAQLVHIYSVVVDFKRDIQPGTKLSLLYDNLYNQEGQKVRQGPLRYASLTLGGKEQAVYRFTWNGQTDYYTEQGRSLRKTLLRVPVDNAIISSHFGWRIHPILKVRRMHKGTDFAAPTGTPIFAAGDGVVVRIGQNGGYGNYIKLKHDRSYETAYAHLHRFARGLRKGSRVKQGEVIGYLGNTGMSTGPHLHYEIIVNGVQKNPLKVPLPKSRVLTGKAREAFLKQKASLEAEQVAILVTRGGISRKPGARALTGGSL